MVSIDGTEPVHDRLRPFVGGRGSFARVASSIQKLVAAGVRVQARATLVHDTIDRDHVGSLLRLARELGVDKVAMSPVEAPASHECSLRPGDLEKLSKIYHEVTAENLEEVGNRQRSEPPVFDPHVSLIRALAAGRSRGLGRCGACFGMAAVATDGAIYPCHRFVGMPDYVIGDLVSGVSSDRVRNFYVAVDRSYGAVCRDCWARQVCGGACYHRYADGDGGFREPGDEACHAFKESLLVAISHLADIRSMARDARSRYGHATRHL